MCARSVVDSAKECEESGRWESGWRRGLAAVELTTMLPLLCLVALIAVDYARFVPVAITLVDCARNGALYLADPALAEASPFATLEEVVQADAAHLVPAPIVESFRGTDVNGIEFVDVTVSYNFRTTVNYPGIPDSLLVRRTVRMPVTPE